MPMCSGFYTVNPGENCTDIVNNANPPLSMLQLYQLNPGIMCSSNGSTESQRLVGQQVGNHESTHVYLNLHKPNSPRIRCVFLSHF